MTRTVGPPRDPSEAGVLFGPPSAEALELTPAALQRCLHSAVFGHRVFYYPIIGSTNDRALELCAGGEPEGSLVLAEEQTGGRGRRARAWTSRSRLGIYASLVLRPGAPAPRAPLFTFIAAVSVAGALREACSLAARIKWPNDVVIGARKIAGILGEVRGSSPEVRELVMGLGVNVNQASEDFPPELRSRATSARIESGVVVDRAPILALILEGFERRYARLLRGEASDLLREWESLSAIPTGGSLVVEGPAGRSEGTLRGVDEEGALLLADPGGDQVRVPFGEIVQCLWP
ncbi:MAG TPA: biotin--[acetyl-CoA-carboxylase] ligase [Candidatus Polarisedimenticolia bacterium]|nr:biotin--[acetyl-CoA-carboxylase] ligase [Candidatus Polarisedimenticolia bacterium]